MGEAGTWPPPHSISGECLGPRAQSLAFPPGTPSPGSFIPGYQGLLGPKPLGKGGGAISFSQLVSRLCIEPIQTVNVLLRARGKVVPTLCQQYLFFRRAHLLWEADGTLCGVPGGQGPGLRGACGRRGRSRGRGRGRGGRLTPRCCLERWIMGRRAIANLKPRTVGDTRQPNLVNGSAEPPPSHQSRLHLVMDARSSQPS